jgi:hypothetical protein
MSDGMKLEVPDAQAFLAELQAVPAVMQKRIVRGAVATGASVIRKAVIALAPEYTGDVSQGHPPPGTLKKSIYQVRMSESCSGVVEDWKVSVRTGRVTRRSKGGKESAMPDAYYASWVEFGHFSRAPGLTAKQHRIARAAGIAALAGAKWNPPQSFMRAGFELSKDAALDAMKTYFEENMDLALASFRYIKARQ